jgi:hypothetical protein
MIVNGFATHSSDTLLEKYSDYTLYPVVSKNTIVVGVDFYVLALAKKQLNKVDSLFVIDTPFHLNRCNLFLADCVYIPPGRYVKTRIKLSKGVVNIPASFTKKIYLKAAKKLASADTR